MDYFWNDIFFDYLCPFMGCLIASTLFAAPINDLRVALQQQSLGSLNPNPWAVLTGNCLGWSAYAYFINDPFILASNLPGLILSFWLNIGAAKLQYLQQVQTLMELNHNNHNNIDTTTISTDRILRHGQQRIQYQNKDELMITDESVLVSCSQDVRFFRVVTVWSIFLVIVGWLGIIPKRYQSNVVGIMVNINMIYFYFAPLDKMKHVIQTKCSDTIHGPTITLNCINALFWFLYGLTINDIVVYGPNTIGLVLGTIQVLLCWWYPKSNVGSQYNNQRNGRRRIREFQLVATHHDDTLATSTNIGEVEDWDADPATKEDFEYD